MRRWLNLPVSMVTKSVDENGFEKSRMMILTLILRLRQICCHPLIAGVDLGHRSVSGKMELLKETLGELVWPEAIRC